MENELRMQRKTCGAEAPAHKFESRHRFHFQRFLTPLFGATFGVLLLGETFSSRFLAAALLVLVGIALVNAPARSAAAASRAKPRG